MRYPLHVIRSYRAYKQRKKGTGAVLSFDAWINKHYPQVKEEAVEPHKESEETDPETPSSEPDPVEERPTMARTPVQKGKKSSTRRKK